MRVIHWRDPELAPSQRHGSHQTCTMIQLLAIEFGLQKIS